MSPKLLRWNEAPTWGKVAAGLIGIVVLAAALLLFFVVAPLIADGPARIPPTATASVPSGEFRIVPVAPSRTSGLRLEAVRLIREDSLLRFELRVENHGRHAVAFCTREDYVDVELRDASGGVDHARLRAFEDKMPVPGFGDLAILPPGRAGTFVADFGEQDQDLSGVAAFRVALRPCPWYDERSNHEIRARKAEPLPRDLWSEWAKPR